ncbi:variable surface lipoprotein [Mycoplasmopsis arginini]|uniref:variable surface lipoprotein n=1 Tax=Mycoplasmopsis arginini TaxID=2094 RepID=UPI002735514C|nr:variable surface lipoprotein [Mycoplasmopsis arginini]MDP4043119.1 variable surface lipoprotein [Mycoplasmopsis arginini]
MKKSLKIVLSISPLAIVLSTPLIAASCKKEVHENTTIINEINSSKVFIEKIVKYEEEENEKANAQKILNEINEFQKVQPESDHYDTKSLKEFLQRIKSAINSFKQRNTQEKSGLVVQKIVENQEEKVASEVVGELKAATNWNDVKTVFQKYGISFTEKELAENEELSIAESTHAHNDEGEIHLDIKFKIAKSKVRFTLLGFKKVEPITTIQNWKFGTKLVGKLETNEVQQAYLNKLKEDQAKGFQALLVEFKKHISVEVVDKSNTTLEFRIKFDETQTKIEGNKLHLLIEVYDNTNITQVIESKVLVVELEDEHDHHHEEGHEG